jgi:hypothetical protein
MMIKPKNIFLLVIIAALLSACATPEERARREAQRQAQVEEAAKAIVNRCKAYGFKENTDAFASCIQTEVQAYKQTQAANEQIARERTAAGVKNLQCSISGTCGKTICNRTIFGTVECKSY